MDIWFGYDFLGLIVRDYIKHSGHCLINAIVIKLRRQPKDYLLKVRQSLQNLIDMINDELNERA